MISDPATFIAWAALALSLVGGLLALLRYINQEIEQERLWREDADEKIDANIKLAALDDLNRHALLTATLADYRLYVAQNYVSITSLREVEERLATAMEKIAARLETIVSRLEKLSIDVATSSTIRSKTRSGPAE